MGNNSSSPTSNMMRGMDPGTDFYDKATFRCLELSDQLSRINAELRDIEQKLPYMTARHTHSVPIVLQNLLEIHERCLNSAQCSVDAMRSCVTQHMPPASPMGGRVESKMDFRAQSSRKGASPRQPPATFEEALAMQCPSSPTQPVFHEPESPHIVASALKAEFALRKTRTPRDVILDLQRGNARFWTGQGRRLEMNAMERRALIIGQAPSVCLLGCSDSRVPAEMVFDQGLGDMFVVRLAGSTIDVSSHGSIEYAVKHLQVKVIMVLGHESCGAVRGAIDSTPKSLAGEPSNLQALLKGIQNNLCMEKISVITDHRAREREAVVANCTQQVAQLLGNKLISREVVAGRLIVCGAFYEISSGIVDFFSQDRSGLVLQD